MVAVLSDRWASETRRGGPYRPRAEGAASKSCSTTTCTTACGLRPCVNGSRFEVSAQNCSQRGPTTNQPQEPASSKRVDGRPLRYIPGAPAVIADGTNFAPELPLGAAALAC